MRRANPISEGSYVKGERHAVNVVDVYVLYMILRCVCTVHTVGITRALKVKHMYGFLGAQECVKSLQDPRGPTVLPSEDRSRLSRLWINPANMCVDVGNNGLGLRLPE